tara:strand:+ start:1618 stop:2070 length:453 start_codon:yes stop_codon:yes gene_type:complete
MNCFVNKKNLLLVLLVLLVVFAITIMYFSIYLSYNIESFTNTDISSKEDLYDLLSEDDIAIVKFYVNYCGWCKKLAPTWNEFEKEYNNKKINGKKIMVLSVDCEKHPDMCRLFKIKGYPTILIIKNNETIEYNDERTVTALKNVVTNVCK